MLILEYISTHGTPGWCAARMSARESKGPLYIMLRPILQWFGPTYCLAVAEQGR